MLENSWNTSVRNMYNLPLQTHRYFIEPISNVTHLKFILIDRFLRFLEQIEKSRKTIPKHILKYVKHDVRSTTGSNLRNILLLVGKNTVEEISTHDIKALKYHGISVEDTWKVNFIHEITNIKNNQLLVNEFTKEELNDILEYLCTS